GESARNLAAARRGGRRGDVWAAGRSRRPVPASADAVTRAVAAAALVALLVVVPARADGDPASDILYGDNVFLSLVSPQVNAKGRALEQLTAAAAQRGLPLKVAVVQSPTDLGAVPQLFGKARWYVKFLRVEITYGRWKGTLIV